MDQLVTPAPKRARVPAWAVDVVLAIGVTATLAIVISSNQGGEQDPDALAYLWAVGLGALMLARRRYPIVVLAISTLGLFAYYAAGYPAVGVAVPVAAALYSAAERDRLPWAIGAGLTVLAVSVAFRLAEGQSFSYVVGYELAGQALLVAGALALGDSVRSRRELAESTQQLLRATADRQQLAIESAAQAERTAISRELHDSLGHSITVISLHANVAREALGRDDVAVASAIGVVTSTSQSMLAELRETVRVLRDPSRRPTGPATLAELQNAVRGLPITVTTEITLGHGIPEDINHAGLRIAQEALTNVVRHSGATTAVVTAVEREDGIHLSITDAGPRRPTKSDGPGQGITGMRERAEALGGSLDAGPEGDGFAVRALLPIGAST